MEAGEAEIVDAAALSQNFPKLPTDVIWRDNIIQTITTMYEHVNVVVVEGADSIGKTFILAQFAKINPKNCFSIFIQPFNRYSYDQYTLMYDLAIQMHWVLYHEVMNKEEPITMGFLNNLYNRLQNQANRKRMCFYFIIDGLDLIPINEWNEIKQSIYDLLPLANCFRFLYGCRDSAFLPSLNSRMLFKPFMVPSFTFPETLEFFKNLPLQDGDKADIHKISCGNPGKLASIRRIYESGKNVQNLNPASTISAFYELEFSASGIKDEIILQILSLIAFDHRNTTIKELSDIVRIPEKDVISSLSKYSYIYIDAENLIARFTTESFREFLKRKLDRLKKNTIELRIDYLSRTPDSEDALNHLPALYEEANKCVELLHFLNPENMAKIIHLRQSVYPAREKADQGIKAAQILDRNADLVKLVLEKTAMTDYSSIKLIQYEMEALISNGDVDRALRLATSIALKEERIILLSFYVKTMREYKQEINKDTIENLAQLINQTDLKHSRSNIVNISRNIYTVLPQLSIELLKMAFEGAGMDKSIDNLFEMIGKDTNELSPVIKDTKGIQTYPAVTSRSDLNAETPKDRLFKTVESFNDTKNKLFMLRKWILDNQANAEAVSVCEYALKLIISSTEYAPNATVYRELAASLNSCDDVNALKNVIGRLDNLNPLIKKAGPSVEYIRLLLNLVEAEAKYDVAKATKRYEEVFYLSSHYVDLPTKATCMAWIACVGNCSVLLSEGENQTVAILANEEAQKDITSILHDTGDHYAMVKDVLEPLLKYNPEYAINLASSLNLKQRRDHALFDCVKFSLRKELATARFDIIEAAINKIDHSTTRDEAILLAISAMCNLNRFPLINQGEVVKFSANINKIVDLGIKCNAIAIFVQFLDEADKEKFKQDIEEKIDQLKTIWSDIDNPKERLFYGFNISRDLSSVDKNVSAIFINESNKLKAESGLDIYDSFSTYFYMLKIAIKAFSGISKDKTELIDQLEIMIDKVASNGEKAMLWSDIALSCYLIGNKNQCESVVLKRIKRYLEEINQSDTSLRGEVIAYIAPALYVSHEATALEIVDALGEEKRDGALDNIVKFLINKKLMSEPYEFDENKAHEIAYETLVSILALLEKMLDASYISFYLRIIVNEIDSKNGSFKFTREQTADIASRVKKLIKNKLTLVDKLGHCGYEILGSAYLARLEKANDGEWDRLIDDASKIRNASDSCMVLSEIAVLLPSRMRTQSARIVKNILPCRFKKIPSLLDRLERTKEVSMQIRHIDGAFAREYMSNIYTEIVKGDTGKEDDYLIGIVDVAYKIDPAFAEKLIEGIDDDPARRAKKNADKKLKEKKREDEFINGKLDVNPSRYLLEQYPIYARQALGLLNAGKISAPKKDSIINMFLIAARMPINKAYYLIYYAVECIIRNYKASPVGDELLRAVFEGSIISTNLTLSINKKKYDSIVISNKVAEDNQQQKQRIIQCGDRELAFNTIKGWILRSGTSHIKICDAYFSPDDLEIIKLIMDVKENMNVQIVTSWSNKNSKDISIVGGRFKAHWKAKYSQQPPEVDIHIIGTETQKHPLHDRWMLFEDGGVRIGTSFNSLGITKQSEITFLEQEEASVLEEQIDKYINRKCRIHLGEKMEYKVFTL